MPTDLQSVLFDRSRIPPMNHAFPPAPFSLVKNGARGGTRTRKDLSTCTSSMRVCQFHHPSKAEKRRIIYHNEVWRASLFFDKMSAMFEVRNICFLRRGANILSGVTFSIPVGEVVAVTGANGVGKTTLLKILSGVWLPSSGTAVVDGTDMLVEPIRYRRRLGWLGETAPADEDLTVKAYLKYRARLKGEQSRKIRHRVHEALAVCGLDSLAGVVVGNLSRGQRKRVALAEAVLLRPRLLLLDDVFAGLDSDMRRAVALMIASFLPFASVVVAGHETDMFEQIGARVLELKDGRVA